MNNTNRLDLLKQQYFDLSKAFLIALQDDRSFEELETIRKQIREVVTELETLELKKEKTSE
jgi:hypothetical protein